MRRGREERESRGLNVVLNQLRKAVLRYALLKLLVLRLHLVLLLALPVLVLLPRLLLLLTPLLLLLTPLLLLLTPPLSPACKR